MTDVAVLAKVSKATVSRAINSPGRVDAETRGRVQSAIKALGYVPDGVARSLRTQRSMTIGMCVPTLAFASFTLTVETVQTDLRAAGYNLQLAVSGYDIEQERHDVEAMVGRGIDAVVLIGGRHDPELIALLKSRSIPYVFLWSVHEEHPSIGFDHRRAMVKLVSYLVDLGHKRIGSIMADIEQNDRVRDRLLGIGDALESRGLPFPADYQRTTTLGLKASGTAMAELLTLPHPPTAVVCATDSLAVGAVLECQRRGFRVPVDMSVTGFSATELGEAMMPPITTVATPVVELGQRAVRHLLERLSGKVVNIYETLPTEILVRGSTAPPRTASRTT